MKIILLYNGLGNQMSQYAFYLAQESHKMCFCNTYFVKRKSVHNGYELDKVFKIPDTSSLTANLFIRFIRKLLVFYEKPYTTKLASIAFKLLNIIGIRVIKEHIDYGFDRKNLLPQKGINIYVGGWHSEKYIKEKECLIRQTFQFDFSSLNALSANIYDKIRLTESISIHIRRGDYLSAYYAKLWGDVCSSDYYHKAIKFITDKIPNASFFVFSDDIAWVKENLNIPNPMYIEHNVSENSWQDMCLMSQCKHHIVANSTFSWWGAWLGKNKEKIVIAPSRFYNISKTPDFFPEEWIKIEV